MTTMTVQDYRRISRKADKAGQVLGNAHRHLLDREVNGPADVDPAFDWNLEPARKLLADASTRVFDEVMGARRAAGVGPLARAWRRR